MAVKIRLRRMGKKKQPHYRIVVADSRSPRDGRFVENLGYYNPLTSPARLVVDLDRVDYWLAEGAVVTDTVSTLVSKARTGGDDTVSLGALDPEEARAAKKAEAEARKKAEEAAVEAEAAPEEEAAPEAEEAAAEEEEAAEGATVAAAAVAEEAASDAAEEAAEPEEAAGEEE